MLRAQRKQSAIKPVSHSDYAYSHDKTLNNTWNWVIDYLLI